MKIWSVFSLVILFHVAVISLLLIQPGCQSQPADKPSPAQTSPARTSDYVEPSQSATLDPAFNSGMPSGSATAGSSTRGLSAPTRPETVQRSAPDTGLLQPVNEPVTDSFSLPPVTREYTVKKGDTLSGIARSQGVSLSELLSANGLSRNSTIYVGQSLFIPETQSNEDFASNEMEDSGKEVVVQRGDTLSGIASRNGTTVQTIKALNQMSSDTIYVGQKLKVPSTGSTSSPSTGRTATVTTSGNMTTYTVKSGDTPSGIARRFGITSRELMAANNITDPRRLYVGRQLVVPTSGTTAAPQQQQASTTTTTRSTTSTSQPVRRETSTTQPQMQPPTSPPAEDDPMAALEALEDEDLPFVEVEVIEEDNSPEN